jgi:hypothetical protein
MSLRAEPGDLKPHSLETRQRYMLVPGGFRLTTPDRRKTMAGEKVDGHVLPKEWAACCVDKDGKSECCKNDLRDGGKILDCIDTDEKCKRKEKGCGCKVFKVRIDENKKDKEGAPWVYAGEPPFDPAGHADSNPKEWRFHCICVKKV